jgi:hypothetical protein
MTVGKDKTEKDANSSYSVLSGALEFILCGDGDDHGHMATGEFHVFDPSSKPSSGTATATGRWRSLSPHPGRSRWAPGSFVLWDTAHVYFSGGYDHVNRLLFFADYLWTIDLSSLFLPNDDDSNSNAPPSLTTTPPPSITNNSTSSAGAAALTAVNPMRHSLFLVVMIVSSITCWILMQCLENTCSLTLTWCNCNVDMFN